MPGASLGRHEDEAAAVPPEARTLSPAERSLVPAGLPERAVPLRREVLWALGAAASYGVTLFLGSADLVLLAIPGILGLVVLEVIAVRYVLRRPSRGAPVSYLTDGSDHRGPVNFLYAALLKRYAALVVSSLVLMAVPLVTRAIYLMPLLVVGLLGITLGTVFWLDQLRWVRQCARILHVYPFEFRAPVYGLELLKHGKRVVVLGYQGLESPDMVAREPMGHPRWPDRIADGGWFAGDEVFGGVLLVPGTGELMCMQPLDWDDFKQWRNEAGEERRAQAKRAGIDDRAL